MGVFSKNKDEVFVTFKVFHALVENEMGKNLNNFHTDHVVEVLSNHFNSYFTKMCLNVTLQLHAARGKMGGQRSENGQL